LRDLGGDAPHRRSARALPRPGARHGMLVRPGRGGGAGGSRTPPGAIHEILRGPEEGEAMCRSLSRAPSAWAVLLVAPLLLAAGNVTAVKKGEKLIIRGDQEGNKITIT